MADRLDGMQTLFQEFLVPGGSPHSDFHKNIKIAGCDMYFKNFRERGNFLAHILQIIVLPFQREFDQNSVEISELLHIKRSMIPGDIALAFQAFGSLPARACRQPDLGGQILVALATVLAKLLQNLFVEMVQLFQNPRPANGKSLCAH